MSSYPEAHAIVPEAQAIAPGAFANVPEAHAIDAQLIRVGGGGDNLPPWAHAEGVHAPPFLPSASPFYPFACLWTLPFAFT